MQNAQKLLFRIAYYPRIFTCRKIEERHAYIGYAYQMVFCAIKNFNKQYREIGARFLHLAEQGLNQWETALHM